MQIVNLYRYEETNGIAISPVKRNESDTPHAYRIIADEGKCLIQNGVNYGCCTDSPTAEGWEEIDDPGIEEEPNETMADMKAALDVLGVTK